jgi:hypothetical protein
MKNNMNALVAKAVAIWIVIAAGEILNGNFRVRFLHRKYGINRAKKISFFTGITIIYTICWYTLPWVNPSSLQDCFLIGLIWMLLMLCVDIYFGRYVFRFNWIKIIEDFDLRKGNLLGVGMGLLFLCPTIVYLLT